MSAITGRDAGDLKKYRTEIPNIVFMLGLDPYALSLYCHLKRTTGAADGGVCWKSTRTLAKETGMSLGKVSEARGELEKPRGELGGKALITVERPKDRSKSTNVVCEDVWPENFGVFTTRTRECSPHERKKEPVVEEGVEAKASSGKPQSEGVAVEKYITDRVYEAMRESTYRLPNEDFGFHLGRARDMLDKDGPTDEEIEALPAAFVRTWEIRGKADAQAALMEMRRQKGREKVLKASQDEQRAPGWETPNPHGEKSGEFARKPRDASVYLAFYPGLPASAVKEWVAGGLLDDEILQRCEEWERTHVA